MSQPPLRPGQNGSDGYTNGYYKDEISDHYDQEYSDGDPVGGEGVGAVSREGSAGGDGELHDGTPPAESNTRQLHTLPRPRGQASESLNERPDLGDRAWTGQSRSRGDGIRRVGAGQGSRQIEG